MAVELERRWMARGYSGFLQTGIADHRDNRQYDLGVGSLKLIYTYPSEYLIDADGTPIIWSGD